MLSLAGYADRMSVRPGETIAFKISSLTMRATWRDWCG